MQKFKFKTCLELYIINDCNLTCSNCNRYNNYNFQGYYNWKDNADAVIAWSKRVTAPQITLIGGEPALHPHLTDWVAGVANAWPDVPVVTQTNGTVPVKEIGRIRKFTNTGFGLAVHDTRMHKKLSTKWNFLDSHGIFDATEFSDCALIDQGNNFVVHQSDPDQAFESCSMKYSHTLFQGRLYKCPMVAVLPEFRKQYQVDLTDAQEKLLYSYQSLGPDCSDQELEHFIQGEDSSIPQCSLCPSQQNLATVNFDINRKKRIKIRSTLE